MQTTLSSNTSTEWFYNHGGSVFAQASGTFGSGTLTLECLLTGGSVTHTLEDGSFTSGPVSKVVTLGPGVPVRFTLAGSSGASIVTELLACRQ